MATLIPSTIPDGTPSSERRIFNFIKSDSGAEDWTVFHSIGLAQRGYDKPYGEIDFVIAIPRRGVLCLEVKGGRVSCIEGQWSTTDHRGITHTLNKSPFDQVRTGMAALRGSVIEHAGNNLSRCFFGTAVVFPDVASPPITTEFREDEVIDVNEIGEDLSSVIIEKIDSQRARLIYGRNPSLDNPSEIDDLVTTLRPDFELRVTHAARIRNDKADLNFLLREQHQYLHGCMDNSRCLVKGAAGTGKTMLAIESLKLKNVENAEIGIFCFNKVFGGWLRRAVKKLNIQKLYMGAIHEELVKIIRKSSLYSEFIEKQKELEKNSSDAIFSKLIPDYAIAAIKELNLELECLILDEGQDLMRPELLRVFDVWLRGGLKKGNWMIFGDFNNQAIYSGNLTGNHLIAHLDEHAPNYSNFNLTVNCRNTKNIAQTTAILTGFQKLPYKLNDIEGLPVDRSYWKNEDELIEILNEKVKKLLTDNVSPSEITILSPRRYENSSAYRLNGYKIVDISGSSTKVPNYDEITFSTIHSFKGLESPAVIITDIMHIGNRSLIYVAMSRASGYLSLLINENAREQLTAAMVAAIDEYDL